MINASISLAAPLTGTGAPHLAPAVVERLGDVYVAGSSGTTIVATEVPVPDVPVDGPLRLYAPQPGNGRE